MSSVTKQDLEDSILHQHTFMLMEWILRIRQTLTSEHEKLKSQEMEMEIALKPTLPFTSEPNRANDVGYPLYSKIRQSVTDAVIAQDKEREQKNISTKETYYQKDTYTDFFYVDGSVRQRVWDNDTNRKSGWTRKHRIDLVLPLDWNLNKDTNETIIEKQISAKIQLKHEKPVLPLPVDIRAVFARRKTTHKCRFPEYAQCWVDLSEIQNMKFSSDGKQVFDEGPASYEIEIELSNSLLLMPPPLNSHSSIRYRYKEHDIEDITLWIDCANIVSQLFGLVGIQSKKEKDAN